MKQWCHYISRYGMHFLEWPNQTMTSKRSPMFDDALEGCVSNINSIIIGNDYSIGYYLIDGTYLRWVTFVKTIPQP